jgi:hypothetical protein
VTFTNRTKEKAENAAHEYGGQVLPWNTLKDLWCHFPCVIAATRAPTYLLSPQNKNSSLLDQLLIDLSVPRTIDPALGKTKELLNMESFLPKTSSLKNSLLETTLTTRARKDFLALTTSFPKTQHFQETLGME